VNGYVEAGYLVIFGSLGTYGVALLGRERAARRRVLGPAGAGSTGAGSTGAGSTGAGSTGAGSSSSGAESFTDSGESTTQVGDGPTAKPQHAPLATEEPEPAPGAMS
jgi:hypothetical protein